MYSSYRKKRNKILCVKKNRGSLRLPLDIFYLYTQMNYSKNFLIICKITWVCKIKNGKFSGLKSLLDALKMILCCNVCLEERYLLVTRWLLFIFKQHYLSKILSILGLVSTHESCLKDIKENYIHLNAKIYWTSPHSNVLNWLLYFSITSVAAEAIQYWVRSS